MNPTNELVADLKAANKVTSKINRIMVIITTVCLVIFAGYYVYSTQHSENQLKQIINNHYQTTQSRDKQFAQELAAIQSNHNETQAELNKQTAYFTCVINLLSNGNYPSELASCPQPYDTTDTSTTQSAYISSSPSKSSATPQNNSSSISKPNSNNNQVQNSSPSPNLIQRDVVAPLKNLLQHIGL